MIWNFNYNQAIKQASRVEAIAEDMRNLANNRLENAYAAVNAAWDGETSELFRQHCKQTKSGLLERSNRLNALAKRMREVARILKEAEERARRELR